MDSEIERFDVVIVNKETNLVSSVAVYARPLDAATADGKIIRMMLRPEMKCLIEPRGRYRRGESIWPSTNDC